MSATADRRHFLGRLVAGIAGGGLLARAGAAEATPLGTPDRYVGEIKLFAGSYAPQGWIFCHGQTLSIAQNQPLFMVIGTTYGGNGVNTFQLPNLQGRVPIHFGQGPGLTARTLGEMGGEANHTLTLGEMPAHRHVARGNTAAGSSASPVGQVAARHAGATPLYAATADSDMGAGALTTAGGGQPHANLQPYLVLTYIIALSGIFPDRP